MAAIDGLTIEDFETLPSCLVRGRELVDGGLVEMPGRTLRHNMFRTELTCRLRRFVEDQGLGIVISSQGFAFGDDVYAPDVSFFGPEKRNRIRWDSRVQPFVPDAAFEVISAVHLFDVVISRARRFRKHGVSEVYIFSPAVRQVFCYRTTGDRILDEGAEFRSDLLPGLSIALAELFAESTYA